MGRAWRPDEVCSVPPDKFAKLVEALLVELGAHVNHFEIVHRPSGTEPQAEYEIEVITSVEAFGRDFLILIDCKHSRRPVECDAVRNLTQRIQAGEAQKGMIFTNRGFPTETIDCAAQMGIALICIADGETAFAPFCQRPPESGDPEYIGLWASPDRISAEDTHMTNVSRIYKYWRICSAQEAQSLLQAWLDLKTKA